MKLTAQRISELADMCAMHIAFGRTQKALLIAQFLRRATGWCMARNLNPGTGYRNYQQ